MFFDRAGHLDLLLSSHVFFKTYSLLYCFSFSVCVCVSRLKVSVVVGDSVWLLDEETGLPMEVPLEVIPMEMTPPPQVAMPSAPDTSERAGESASQSERGTEKAAESSCGEVCVCVPVARFVCVHTVLCVTHHEDSGIQASV